MKRLGIIDWGIGGISILKLIKKDLGDVPVIYFSDTGATPYGKMTRSELVSRLNKVISFLRSKGFTHLLIGCNAASTAIPFLDDHSIKIEGVIDKAIGETIKLKPKNLGLIGGRRTVLSGVYRNAFAKKGVSVRQRIAQPLSASIENGDISSARLRDECRKILTPLKTCSHILLACTHYPAIISVMKDHVNNNTIFIDPAPALVNVVGKWDLPFTGGDIYFTTGSAAKMKSVATAAFDWSIENVVKIEV